MENTNNNYDNIEFCRDTLYKFLENDIDFYVEPIIIQNITRNDIIKPDNYEYDGKILEKLTLIHETNNVKFYNNMSLQLIVSKKKMSDKLDNGCLYNYVLSEITTIDRIPCVLLNIMNFVVDNEIISVYENKNKFVPLKDMLTSVDMMVVFKKILKRLVLICNKLKNFRHNLFTINSIFISEDGRTVKVTNFENASCDLFTTHFSKPSNIDNPFYDIYSLFSSYMNYCLDNKIKVDDKIERIIENIIPEKIRDYSNVFLDEKIFENSNIQSVSSSDILKKHFNIAKINDENNIKDFNSATDTSVDSVSDAETGEKSGKESDNDSDSDSDSDSNNDSNTNFDSDSNTNSDNETNTGFADSTSDNENENEESNDTSEIFNKPQIISDNSVSSLVMSNSSITKYKEKRDNVDYSFLKKNIKKIKKLKGGSIEMSNKNEHSLTESNNDNSRFLAKKINYKKINYKCNNIMIRGSRKLIELSDNKNLYVSEGGMSSNTRKSNGNKKSSHESPRESMRDKVLKEFGRSQEMDESQSSNIFESVDKGQRREKNRSSKKKNRKSKKNSSESSLISLSDVKDNAIGQQGQQMNQLVNPLGQPLGPNMMDPNMANQPMINQPMINQPMMGPNMFNQQPMQPQLGMDNGMSQPQINAIGSILGTGGLSQGSSLPTNPYGNMPMEASMAQFSPVHTMSPMAPQIQPQMQMQPQMQPQIQPQMQPQVAPQMQPQVAPQMQMPQMGGGQPVNNPGFKPGKTYRLKKDFFF